jgi:hypothetical protein
LPYTRFSIPTSTVLMWDVITSACPFLHRNLTLNLERWVQPLLTSQDYKKLLLNVRAHTVSRSDSLPSPSLRPPAFQCAPSLRLGAQWNCSQKHYSQCCRISSILSRSFDAILVYLKIGCGIWISCWRFPNESDFQQI